MRDLAQHHKELVKQAASQGLAGALGRHQSVPIPAETRFVSKHSQELSQKQESFKQPSCEKVTALTGSAMGAKSRALSTSTTVLI